MLTAKNQEYINKLFSKISLFEKDVLKITSEADRVEVMKLIASDIVRNTHKSEYSFLSIEEYQEFNFKALPRIIFDILEGEWISFATEILNLDKNDLRNQFEESSQKEFLHILSKHYFLKYCRYIYETISDTFIELVSTVLSPKKPSKKILSVLHSDLVLNQNISIIYNFEQLYLRVKAAKDYKASEISKLQIKISETISKISDTSVDILAMQDLKISLRNYEDKLENLDARGLENFDGAIKRLKDTMVNNMLTMSLEKN